MLPDSLLGLPDSLLGHLWPKGHLFMGMHVSKGLLKLLPAIVPDVVLRIKLDKNDDRFVDGRHTDWDFKAINKERVQKSLSYFQSTRGFGLHIDDNGSKTPWNNLYRNGIPDLSVLDCPQSKEAFQRNDAFEEGVIRAIHAAIYNGTIRNLAVLHISTPMATRAVELLIKDNTSTLKSISFDGTRFDNRVRFNRSFMFAVQPKRMMNLHSLKLVRCFQDEFYLSAHDLPHSPLPTTIVLDHRSISDSFVTCLSEMIYIKNKDRSDFNITMRTEGTRNAATKFLVMCLPQLNTLRLEMRHWTDEAYDELAKNLHTAKNMTKLTLMPNEWKFILGETTKQKLRDICNGMGIELLIKIETYHLDPTDDDYFENDGDNNALHGHDPENDAYYDPYFSD